MDDEKFEYPYSFMKVIQLHLSNLKNWKIMNKNQVNKRRDGLKQRYPSRALVPFAQRDQDDIACFEIGKGQKVEIVRDFAVQGQEQIQEYGDFWQWLESAVEGMIDNRELMLQTMREKIVYAEEMVILLPCPCCRYRTLEARGQYDICPVCFWADDGNDDDDQYSRPNHMTLKEGKNNFLVMGAVSEKMAQFMDSELKKYYSKDEGE